MASWRVAPSMNLTEVIPVDDASQIRSVQAMLEYASRTATKPSLTPTAPAKPECNLNAPQDTPFQHATTPNATLMKTI